MPKGKHKGGRRQFTNFEALEEQKKKEEKEKQWRKTQGEESEDEEGAEKKSDDSSEESSSEEEEVNMKPKGVSALIETENPNRIVHKPKKVSQMSSTPPAAATGSSKPQLSRREREEIEKQKATAHYRKMHAEGKTEEARADLARLAIIKQQREEAAKKKEDERISREEAAAAKKDKLAKALNKKS